MRWNSSIHRRMTAILLLMVALTWGVVAALMYWDAIHRVEHVFDANLEQSAHVLAGLVRHEAEEGELEEINAGHFTGVFEHDHEAEFVFVIRHPDGSVLLQSPGAPAFPLLDGPRVFEDHRTGSELWRVFQLDAPRVGYIVQVGERSATRDGLVQRMAIHSLAPFSLLLPLLAVTVWWGVGRGLAPLQRLVTEVDRRAADTLSPVDLAGAPSEMHPIVDALNHLLERLRGALDKERRFTGDAAHELRTPLAALKTHAQVAERAKGAGERSKALRSILIGVDRATHLVEQLLALARTDSTRAANESGDVDLRAVAERVLAELAPWAIEAGIELELEAPREAFPVRGETDGLTVLVRNLVDNAVRYAPPGTRVLVELRADADCTLLCITDAGPGIPPEHREQVFERFQRLDRRAASGSGLGLSIVKNIAQLYGAAVELTDGPGGVGTLACVRFPQPVHLDPESGCAELRRADSA